MLHHRDNDFVTILEHLAKGRCHQVDALGRATGKNHLLDAVSIDESAHFLASELDQVGCLLRERVYTAMHIGLVVIVHLVNGLDDGSRRLGRCGIVEIDERASLNLALKDGIILAYLVDVHFISRSHLWVGF